MNTSIATYTMVHVFDSTSTRFTRFVQNILAHTYMHLHDLHGICSAFTALFHILTDKSVASSKFLWIQTNPFPYILAFTLLSKLDFQLPKKHVFPNSNCWKSLAVIPLLVIYIVS